MMGLYMEVQINGPSAISNVKLNCINEIFVVTGKPWRYHGEIFYTTNLNSLNSLTIK